MVGCELYIYLHLFNRQIEKEGFEVSCKHAFIIMYSDISVLGDPEDHDVTNAYARMRRYECVGSSFPPT